MIALSSAEAIVMGMPNRLILGYGRTEGKVDPGDIKTAQLYGQRIAKATQAWQADKVLKGEYCRQANSVDRPIV